MLRQLIIQLFGTISYAFLYSIQAMATFLPSGLSLGEDVMIYVK